MKKYPSDPDELVKKRLEDFLRGSAAVNFNPEPGSSRSFADPEYEKIAGMQDVPSRRQASSGGSQRGSTKNGSMN